MIFDALRENQIELEKGDILVITQKIVSKSENRLVNLAEVNPSSRAIELGEQTQKDPRLVEMILRESNEVLRARPGLLIVEHQLGFVCANAGIDHSNVEGPHGSMGDWVLLLPKDPSQSASLIRQRLLELSGVDLGVLIIDSHGRAWREGTVGISIGLSGIPALVDMRGKEDLYGHKLRYTIIATADELAAAASLVMGQVTEKIPVVHVRGFPYDLQESEFTALIRKKEQDLFR
jgi:coenzyme F420-0:L-glutamate ligase/coenzyme F420-1:gamma-L-glutamate ligase